MGFKTAILFGLGLFTALSNGAPAEVLIIRHGEKPLEGHDLSPQGYARAAALPQLFLQDTRLLQFGKPVAIYAMTAPADRSNRTIETVTPLAAALGLNLNTNFVRPEIDDLTHEILNNPDYEGKTVLICWEHKMIAGIAQALGVTPTPDSWSGSVFDRVWKIDFENGRVMKFENLAQKLLPGDTPD
jgi:hypothetical protein